jgi:flavin reductase (DIM6/NTAB) family NADH-FMN oxidoreductase RutF
MRVIDPKNTSPGDLYQYLISTVNPRPIAFVSTVDAEGRPNLAPFSFFNCFSANPPILVFSTTRRIADNKTKDTLHNIEATGEAVINAVSFRIARQMAVASVSYPKGVNEFDKSGLTPIPADLVRPFRVRESPVHFECKLRQVITLGDGPGAGHLIVCEIVRMHVDESVFDDEDRINPHKLDVLGRMGRAFYVRASGEAIYKIYQPQEIPAIGFDQLPPSARQSKILTGNNLGQLAGLAAAPETTAVQALRQEPRIRALLASPDPLNELHRYAQTELAKENTELAACIVWLAEEVKTGEEGRDGNS